MTEEQARKKICPFFYVMGTNLMANAKKEGISTSVEDLNQLSSCAASDCMMWVTTDSECKPEPEHSQANDRIHYAAGYCGLTK